jgi:prepilin peptidase CpaA
VLSSSLLLVFPSLLVWAGTHDFFTRVIPNRIAIILAAGFVPVAFRDGMASSLVLSHLGCAAIMLLAGLAMFSFGFIGGGDAKLFAAASLWLGWDFAAEFAMATSLFGGGLALIYWARFIWRAPEGQSAPSLPYGVAIAAGGLYLFPDWALSILPPA